MHDDEVKESIKEQIVKRMDKLKEDSDPASNEVTIEDEQPPSKKQKVTALDYLLGPETIITTLTHREELDAYMAESLPPRSTCPLLWWKDNSTKFPLVSKVAKCFLNIPATSTPSERVFSTGGNTVTQQRSSLKPGNVDALIFLNNNANSFS